MREFCSADPKRLYGAPLVSVYDIKAGIKEMQRGHSMGLKGAMIWQVPDPRLPFTDPHYEPLWAACAEAGAPVICHILTGHCYIKTGQKPGLQGLKDAVNAKTNDSANTLFDFIFSGAFDRYPKLRLLLAESEIGWLPFMLQQWDYYYNRFKGVNPLPINKNPSEYFQRQVFGTFFRDTVAGHHFEWWGQDNCMWSNDYPHGNSTWPDSRKYIDRDLGHLPADVRRKLVCTNVAKLYDMEIPQPLSTATESAAIH